MNFPALLVTIMDHISDKNINCYSKFPDVEVIHDLVYNPNYPKDCKLDIHRPKGKFDLMPVLINIHGGSFVATDKHYRRGISSHFAECGFAVLNLNYPLAPKHKYKEILTATYPIFAYITANAQALRLDLTKVHVMGDSAGCYIASALCAMATNPAARAAFHVPEAGITPRTAILYCGVYAPLKLLNEKMILNQQIPIGKAVFGLKSKRDIPNWQEAELADILTHITPDFPKTFLSHTDFDDMCPRQTLHLIDALTKNNVDFWEFRAVHIPCSHDWQLSIWSTASDVKTATVDFIRTAENTPPGTPFPKHYFEI